MSQPLVARRPRASLVERHPSASLAGRRPSGASLVGRRFSGASLVGRRFSGAIIVCALTAACAGEPRSFAQLQKAIGGLDAAAQSAVIERYVQTHGGTPLIENNARLVFLARNVDGRAPRIVGDFNVWAEGAAPNTAAAGVTTALGSSDWSYLEVPAFTNARMEYVLLFDKEAIPDPLNPRTVQEYAGPRSEVRMPHWEAQPEIDDAANVAAGSVLAQTFPTQALGGTRRVWYYLPPGYDTSQDVYPSVYVLDGGTYIERMHTPELLDRLIARKAIPPVIVVFIEPADRQEEYSRNARWRQFITRELVPAVDTRFRTFPGPEQRVVLGSSLAAYGAVDLAIEAPSTFGLCAAIAPPAQTATIISNQTHGATNAQSVRFFILGGVYDPMIDGARKLRTTLGVNANVIYKEAPEGHNAEMFRGRLDEAIGGLLKPQ